MSATGIFKVLKPRHAVGAAAFLAVTITAVYGATTISGWTREPDAAAAPPAAPAQQQPGDEEVPVRGRLVFPQRAELTFGTAGKVGEVLVREGDRVVQGQPLAVLDDLTVSALRVGLAQAESELDTARQELQAALKSDFTGAPLQRAEFEAGVAQVHKEMEDAERRLRDFQRHYRQDLASALQAAAEAETELDAAVTALGYFDRDQSQDLANARKRLADAEADLDRAQRARADFDQNYQADLAAARAGRTSALDALRQAEDTLSEFYASLGQTRRFSAIDDDVPHRSLEELRHLQAAVTAAQAGLEQAERDLAHLEGNRSLLLQETEASVDAARAELSAARDEVADLEAGSRPSLDHQRRRAAVEMARARLAQAEMDLQVELNGPDQAELRVREKAVALAREKLSDLEAPDAFHVAVREARVADAQAKVRDARENLEGATVRAPFDGVVSLVNVKVDDNVNDKSRVLAVVDPTRVEVDGLVDATDVLLVSQGAQARVSLDSLPGRELVGTVLRLAEEPRTERGVVSYSVRIQVALPDDVEVPVRLSPVAVTILLQERAAGAR